MSLFKSSAPLAVMIVMICAASTTMALDDRRTKDQLLKLDPESRLEQTCDTEIMLRISHDPNPYNVDRVVAYSFGEPVFGKNSMVSPLI